MSGATGEEFRAILHRCEDFGETWRLVRVIRGESVGSG